MKNLKNAAYAEQVLRENYGTYVSNLEQNSEIISIQEWCELESESDPNFYRWLFNDSEVSDFGGGLSNEELQVAFDFFESLNTTKKVNKANYEVHQFIGGHFGIVKTQTQDCVYGGDSACEDHYDQDLMNTVFNNWDGSLEYDNKYGWGILSI